jgi:cytochrome d ubiquinol oxidase subunit I
MVLAAFITTCFVIGGVSAWYLRRGVHVAAGKRMLVHAMAFAAIAVPLQIVAGDLHGLNVREHQPVKLAAMEAHWHSEGEGKGVPLVLFAVPNEREERNDYEIAVPKLGSVVLTHTLTGEVQPLKAVPREDRPPVKPVFYAFRVMVGIGTLMLLLALASLWQWRRGRLFDSPLLLRSWNYMLPTGFVALLAGWYVVEIGRQPWVVYGALRTADAVSPTLAAASVWTSLITFAVVYAIVFGAGIWYLTRLVIKGPAPFEPAPDTEAGDKTPARPLSVGNKEAV